MTTARRSGSDRSAFGDWMRNNARLDAVYEGLTVTDVDWCIHRYRTHSQYGKTRDKQHFMLLEEKTHSARPSASQRDTLGILYQILSYQNRKCQPARIPAISPISKKQIQVLWWNMHLLRFSGEGPLDSKYIWWDNRDKPITIETLEKILLFEVSPFTLHPRDERDHHGGLYSAQLDLWSPRRAV